MPLPPPELISICPQRYVVDGVAIIQKHRPKKKGTYGPDALIGLPHIDGCMHPYADQRVEYPPHDGRGVQMWEHDDCPIPARSIYAQQFCERCMHWVINQ